MTGAYPAHPHASMPLKGHSNAPKLSASSDDIVQFLTEVRILGNNAGLSDRQTINWARHYAGKEAELWSGLDETYGEDWSAFTNAVLTYYPDANEIPRIDDLRLFANKRSKQPLSSLGDLGAYAREFRTISDKLLRAAVVTGQQCNDLFLAGLPHDLQKQVLAFSTMRLGRPSSEAPAIADTQSIVAEVLRSGKTFNFSTMSYTDYEPRSPDTRPAAKSTPASDSSLLASTLAQVIQGQTELTKEIASMRRNPRQAAPAPSNTTTAPATAPAPSSAPANAAPTQSERPSGVCPICHTAGHRAFVCPHRNELIQKGYAKDDSGKWLLLPNGERIPGPPSDSLIKRINDALRRNPNLIPPGQPSSYDISGTSAPPKQTAALFEGFYPSVAPEKAWAPEPPLDGCIADPLVNTTSTTAVLELDDSTAEFGSALLANTAHHRYIGAPPPGLTARKNDPEEESDNDDSDVDELQSRSASPATVRAPSPSPTDLTADIPVEPAPLPPDDQGPILKRTRDVAKRDSDSTSDILQKVLSQTIVSLPLKDILEVSPALRKLIKGTAVQRKRAPPTAAVEQVYYSLGPRPTSPTPASDVKEPIAATNAPLREVEVYLDDKFPVLALLDYGASLVAITKDVWAKLGSPLLDQDRIIIEAANGSTAESLGIVPRLRIHLSGFSVLVAAHVVLDGPFDLLLGRPFFIHCCASLVDAPGTNFMRLVHPVTGKSIAIGTRERVPPLASTASFAPDK